ncbi:cyclin family protein ASCRUDRAFT_77856 [Ascoidea rubescens DSM 1968]|uniref:Uncharacterized protein n=1 Tax=Ascoidea rubescens DSM 1968 TaxID=1344418 RepID=A0A1D2VAC6_9ASCO|nr:hypothetical protein ASCRUDRAFT_77856 [Ascoidea rubescens DSM 1968]ODV58622.1 hypothetical protein ASCRUDRAFT_77856 [Ascoidea rubescens DSM 1968]
MYYTSNISIPTPLSYYSSPISLSSSNTTPSQSYFASESPITPITSNYNNNISNNDTSCKNKNKEIDCKSILDGNFAALSSLFIWFNNKPNPLYLKNNSKFIQKFKSIISKTQISNFVIQTALNYLYEFKFNYLNNSDNLKEFNSFINKNFNHNKYKNPDDLLSLILITCLILSNKIVDDCSYTLTTWSLLIKVPSKKLNLLERYLLNEFFFKNNILNNFKSVQSWSNYYLINQISLIKTHLLKTKLRAKHSSKLPKLKSSTSLPLSSSKNLNPRRNGAYNTNINNNISNIYLTPETPNYQMNMNMGLNINMGLNVSLETLPNNFNFNSSQKLTPIHYLNYNDINITSNLRSSFNYLS